MNGSCSGLLVNVTGVVTLYQRNYFVPCLIFLILITLDFLREMRLYKLLGIFMLSIGVFLYSPLAKNISSALENVLVVILFLLGASIAGITAKDRYKR
jgi:hypothetical protein